MNSNSPAPNSPTFETFFTKNKKMFLFMPIILIGLLVGLYFVNNENSASPNDTFTDKSDLALPQAETKDLPDNKMDAINDFEELNTAKEDELQKSDAIEIDNVNGKATNYQNPDDEVVKKVGIMMKEMNKKSTPSRSDKSMVSKPNYQNTQPVYQGEAQSETKDSFDEFFSSSNKKKSVSDTNHNQTDNITYAAIKGDQLGIRNNQRVTLILTRETVINGKTFPKNSLIYAVASFMPNRVLLNINNINQIPVDVKAYDAEDGGLGLQVKQSLIAESSKETLSDGTNEINVSGVPLGNTMKKIFKRTQQDVRVDLLNNQKLIIKY